ncbi:MAG: ribosome assembly cofactor RimP [Bacteroidales bacterium]|jgi:ribosome maturation factor RimP|nr:ribosome assembly cofactor RimP [Bacteroidales bacterium]
MSILNNDLITKLVLEAIQGTDLFITEVKVKKGNTILVFLDGDNGVSIDSCIQVSRFVEKHLDRDKVDFELNVSSFGLGRPFVMFRQYKNAEGKMLSIKMKDQSKLKGTLIEAQEQSLLLEIQGNKKNPSVVKEISMDEIEEAKLEVVFNKN